MGQKAQQRSVSKRAEADRSKRAAALTAAGLAAAFGSWAYFVLAANPSFYLGLALLALCAVFIAAAVLEFWNSPRLRVIALLLIVAASLWAAWWAKSQWVQKTKNDVDMHLEILMQAPENGDFWHSRTTIKNNSSWRLKHHHIDCEVRQLHSGIIILDDISMTKTWGDNAPLLIGGDSQSDKCLEGWFGATSGRITCADVTISVKYTVDSEPEIAGAKQLRFATDGKEWVPEPVEAKVAMCPDTPTAPIAPEATPPKPTTVTKKKEDNHKSSTGAKINGADNTIYGNVPNPSITGTGNTIVGPTDNRGNTIIRGGTAVGNGATTDHTSVALGAHTHAGGQSNDVSGGIQTGPCSNVQVGGSNNQAMTNCEPPQRTLAPEKEKQFWQCLLNVKDKAPLIMEHAYTYESQTYFDHFANAIRQSKWPLEDSPWISQDRQGTGISVGFSRKDMGSPPSAASLVQCVSAADPEVSFYAADYIPKGRILFYVGVNVKH